MVERIVSRQDIATRRCVECEHERRIFRRQSTVNARIGCSRSSGQDATRPSVCAEIVRSEAAMTHVRVYRRNSQNIASAMTGPLWGGRPTERWQDKSREVRGGRLEDDGA